MNLSKPLRISDRQPYYPFPVNALLLAAGCNRYAIRLADIRETTPPGVTRTHNGQPDYVLGEALLRGVQVPVLHLGLLTESSEANAGRYVVVKANPCNFILAVDYTAGIRSFDAASFDAAKPISLRASGASGVANLEAELLTSLQAVRLVDARDLAEFRGHAWAG